MARYTVGVDFGGTNIKIGLVDDQGRVRRRETLLTSRAGRPAEFVQAAAQAVERLAAAASVRPSALRGLGVGAPGLINVRSGLVHHLVNVSGWHEVPLGRIFKQRLHCPCVVDNDVNVVTLGEWQFGAGRGAEHLFCLTLGTGVGGGIITDRALVRGAGGSAGELGHLPLVPEGLLCVCGGQGCLETQIGSAAIVREAGVALARSKMLQRLAKAHGGSLTPELINRAARAGDWAARRVWSRFGRWLGAGVSSVINLLNPDRVVIGGGLANAWPFFYPALVQTVRTLALDVPRRSARIVRAQLGDEGGIIGGAVLVWQETKG